jgi:hypothetical protein
MANRHSNKRLRAEIKARQAATGESYQAAMQHILARAPRRFAAGFLQARYFGVALTFATWEQHGVHWTMLVPGGGGRAPRRMRALAAEEVRRLSMSPKPVLFAVRRVDQGSASETTTDCVSCSTQEVRK